MSRATASVCVSVCVPVGYAPPTQNGPLQLERVRRIVASKYALMYKQFVVFLRQQKKNNLNIHTKYANKNERIATQSVWWAHGYMNFMVRTVFSCCCCRRAEYEHERNMSAHELDDHVSTKQQVAGCGRRRPSEKPVSTQTPSVRHARAHTHTHSPCARSPVPGGWRVAVATGTVAKSVHSSCARVVCPGTMDTKDFRRCLRRMCGIDGEKIVRERGAEILRTATERREHCAGGT